MKLDQKHFNEEEASIVENLDLQTKEYREQQQLLESQKNKYEDQIIKLKNELAKAQI